VCKSRASDTICSHVRRRTPPPVAKPRHAPSDPDPTNVIGVFGLSVRTNEQDLEDEFSKVSPVEKVVIVYDARVSTVTYDVKMTCSIADSSDAWPVFQIEGVWVCDDEVCGRSHICYQGVEWNCEYQSARSGLKNQTAAATKLSAIWPFFSFRSFMAVVSEWITQSPTNLMNLLQESTEENLDVMILLCEAHLVNMVCNLEAGVALHLDLGSMAHKADRRMEEVTTTGHQVPHEEGSLVEEEEEDHHHRAECGVVDHRCEEASEMDQDEILMNVVAVAAEEDQTETTTGVDLTEIDRRVRLVVVVVEATAAVHLLAEVETKNEVVIANVVIANAVNANAVIDQKEAIEEIANAVALLVALPATIGTEHSDGVQGCIEVSESFRSAKKKICCFPPSLKKEQKKKDQLPSRS
jgi:hypothetical protein